MNQDEKKDDSIKEYGQMTLENGNGKRKIHLLSIIGEVEGHENAPGTSKTTKYDHVLPMLAALEEDKSVEGMLVLWRRCGRRACHCGNDCITVDSYGVPGIRRKPLHRGAVGSIGGLFFYCADGNHDDPSGADERHDYWSVPDI